jgi:hypothetical protein
LVKNPYCGGIFNFLEVPYYKTVREMVKLLSIALPTTATTSETSTTSSLSLFLYIYLALTLLDLSNNNNNNNNNNNDNNNNNNNWLQHPNNRGTKDCATGPAIVV